METIIEIKFPLQRCPAPKRDKYYSWLPWRERWFGWLISWGGGSIGNCSGKTNTIKHFQILRRHILTIHRNEYHDRTDAERADEYLRKWSDCEKELRGLRLLLMGDSVNAEVKKLIREVLGVDFDEGRIL